MAWSYLTCLYIALELWYTLWLAIRSIWKVFDAAPWTCDCVLWLPHSEDYAHFRSWWLIREQVFGHSERIIVEDPCNDFSQSSHLSVVNAFRFVFFLNISSCQVSIRMLSGREALFWKWRVAFWMPLCSQRWRDGRGLCAVGGVGNTRREESFLKEFFSIKKLHSKNYEDCIYYE